ncbi:DUF4226 domain-containing protein [Mycolicibacterium lutetiense]
MFGITQVIRAADSLFGGASESPPPAPPEPAGRSAPAPAAVPSSSLADTLLPPESGSTAAKPGPPQGGTVNPVDINRDAHNEQGPKAQGPKPGLNTTPNPAKPDATKPGASPKPGEPGWEGSAAQKEADAAGKLKTKVEALKSLDQQLDQLGKQIVDDNAEAKKKLKALQDDIDKELKYQDTSADSSVVKQAALNKFMTDKADEAAKVITDAAALVAQRQGQVTGLGNQYPGDVTGAGGGYTDPSGAGGGYGATDPYAAGYGSEYGGEGYGDPYYEEGYGQGEFGDAASQFAGALPQMASALPGMLSGAGGANPLGDLGSVIGSAVKGAGEDRRDGTDRAEQDRKDKEESEKPPVEGDKNAEPKPDVPPATQDPKEEKADPNKPDAKPEGQAPPAPPAPTLVTRPDGTPATAASPASAAAARAILGGAGLEDAYKAAGITLPPPSTPIKDTLPSLASAQIGDLAVFKDRYVMLMGDNKVYMDGQVQAASALAKLTGFVAFRKAPEPTTPFVPATAGPVVPEHAVSPAL